MLNCEQVDKIISITVQHFIFPVFVVIPFDQTIMVVVKQYLHNMEANRPVGDHSVCEFGLFLK